MKFDKINKLNKDNVNQLTIVKDWHEMESYGIWGSFSTVKGNKKVPTITYAHIKGSDEVKMFVLQEDLDIFNEKNGEDVIATLKAIKDSKKKDEDPIEAPTEEPTEEPTEAPTDEVEE